VSRYITKKREAHEAHEDPTFGSVLREHRERRALRDERDGVNEWM